MRLNFVLLILLTFSQCNSQNQDIMGGDFKELTFHFIDMKTSKAIMSIAIHSDKSVVIERHVFDKQNQEINRESGLYKGVIKNTDFANLLDLIKDIGDLNKIESQQDVDMSEVILIISNQYKAYRIYTTEQETKIKGVINFLKSYIKNSKFPRFNGSIDFEF